MINKSPGSSPATDVQTLLATICYLMSRHAETPSSHLANIISDHFSILQNHPDCQSGVLRDLGRRLGVHWHKLAMSGAKRDNSLIH